jgi:thiamine biosynthesis lipoprotein
MDPALFESRKRLLPIFLVAFVVLSAWAIWPQPADPNAPIEYSLQGSTMGTTYSIRVRGSQSKLAPKMQKIGSDVEETLKRVNALMSTWIKDSEISRFNQAPAEEAFAISTETFKVLELAHQVSMLSGGAFDVTVGPLVDAYGFGSGEEKRLDAESLDALKSRVGFQFIQYLPEQSSISKMVPGLRVDLSAIAKGYGVDALLEVLSGHGIKDAMVEIGGEVRAMGINSREIPWRIGIERPETIAGGAQRVVGLADEAMATSGDYRNFRIDESGRRISHTLDPRLGTPVEHGLASVTVIRPTCAEADALATALSVLGPDAGMRLAEEKDWKVLMLIRDGDAIVERMSPAFARQVEGEQS